MGQVAGLISASLRPCNTATFEDMLLQWQAVGNTASDLTSPRFELPTSRSRDERVTAQPTLNLTIQLFFGMERVYVTPVFGIMHLIAIEQLYTFRKTG